MEESNFFGFKITRSEFDIIQVEHFKFLLKKYRLIYIEGYPPSEALLFSIAKKISIPLVVYGKDYLLGFNKYVNYVTHKSNIKISNTNFWHNDRNSTQKICRFTLIQCQTPAEEKGETYICNSIKTFKKLDDVDKKNLRLAVATYYLKGSNDKSRIKKYPFVNEKIIQKHPDTGEECIIAIEKYITFKHKFNSNLSCCDEIKNKIISVLNDGFIYKHQWKKGDILIWDNYSIIHKAEVVMGNSKKKMYVILTR
ncbi:TauD/TfdA family dioxygenase [Spartinivicinus poritis]|uniref:TauD/TfdA family dioxygenase n=1 Tax=Spartinivicinus poritis TaxID=2994640 RepID=A0ABT5UHU8_9GAMM|nr:TauD/TfdA family dioxygenase [Spartinivicinus sp. A2-2]MDE1465935.1 TauD/TfdA family dioxygenase [Spartinivicinus sp. A2-2]